jgi:membrane protein DedA with SNARE-associated domain/rhodanese-related sulfurtransferase
MSGMVELMAKHGYWMLFAALLGRQACLPVPANLLLLAAGALAGIGRLNFLGIVGFSVVALLLADLAWYEAGSKWGSRTFHFICGDARDPKSCTNKLTMRFRRHGIRCLLFSKFVIGLDAVAAPMAGISGIGRARFLAFDAVGAIIWTSAYAICGYVFKDQLGLVAAYSAQFGTLLLVAAGVGVSALVIHRLFRWHRFVREFRLARITPEELWRKQGAGAPILILDLQGGMEEVEGLMAIPGAVRMDPHRLRLYRKQYQDADVVTDREVVLYCGSPSESTSAHVAFALRRRGFESVRPLAGGLQAWRSRGFPLTSQIEMLPLAEHAAFDLRKLFKYSRTNTAQIEDEHRRC